MFQAMLAFWRRLTGTTMPQPSKLASARERNVHATGTFQDATLYDLLIALIQGGKTARLRIHIESEKAIILIVRGKIVNALYHDYIGETAVLEIFSDVDSCADAEYFAEGLAESAVPTASSSITSSMDQLLFKIAMQLEKRRQLLALQC
jgi:hypothetical protein